MFYVKNDTGINQVWVGQVIAPSAYHEVQDTNFKAWRNDSDFIAAIFSGDAIIASTDDGLTDITDPDSAIAFLDNVASTQYYTITFGTGGTVGDTWLEHPTTGGPTNETPYVMAFEGTLAGLTFINVNDSKSIDVEIYKNGSLVFTWEVRDARWARKSDGMGSINFIEGDKISIFGGDFSVPKRPKDMAVEMILQLTNFVQSSETVETGVV